MIGEPMNAPSLFLRGSLLLVLATAAWAGPLRNLRVGQELAVQCEERGCWHQKKIEVLFTLSEELRAEVVEFEHEREIPARLRLGTIKVTPAEAEKLDALFASFRERKDYVSSTAVRVRLRLSSPGEEDRFTHRHRFGAIEPAEFSGALMALAERARAAASASPAPEWLLSSLDQTMEGALEKFLDDLVAAQGLARDYQTDQHYCVNSGPGEDVLGVRLRPRVAGLIEAVEWEIPLNRGVPESAPLAPALAAAIGQLHALPWLRAWKAGSKDNKVTLSFLGREAGGKADEMSTRLRPLWEQSGLRGKPLWRVTASRLPFDTYRCCNLEFLLSDQDQRMLLYSSSPPKRSGWSAKAPSLELVKVGRELRENAERRYAVIEPDGRFEVRNARLPEIEW